MTTGKKAENGTKTDSEMAKILNILSDSTLLKSQLSLGEPLNIPRIRWGLFSLFALIFGVILYYLKLEIISIVFYALFAIFFYLFLNPIEYIYKLFKKTPQLSVAALLYDEEKEEKLLSDLDGFKITDLKRAKSRIAFQGKWIQKEMKTIASVLNIFIAIGLFFTAINSLGYIKDVISFEFIKLSNHQVGASADAADNSQKPKNDSKNKDAWEVLKQKNTPTGVCAIFITTFALLIKWETFSTNRKLISLRKAEYYLKTSIQSKKPE